MAEARRRMLTMPVGWRLRNSTEDDAQVDHEAVQRDWQRALDDLYGDWVRLVIDRQVDDLGPQIRDAVNGGDVTAVQRFTLPSTRGAELLAQAMNDLEVKAERRAIAEPARQGVTINRAPVNSRLRGRS
jgi:hypothetical protein